MTTTTLPTERRGRDRVTSAEIERMAAVYDEGTEASLRIEAALLCWVWMHPTHAADLAASMPDFGAKDFRRGPFGKAWTVLVETAQAGKAEADAGYVCQVAGISGKDAAGILDLTAGATIGPVDALWFMRSMRIARIRREEHTVSQCVASGTMTMDEATDHINALRAGLVGDAGDGSVKAGDAASSYVAKIGTREDDGRLLWSVPAWDRTGSFLRPGDYCIVAAKPGTGKTTLVLQWASQLSTRHGVPVLFYLVEDTAENVAPKTVHCEARVAWRDDGNYSADDMARLHQAAEYLRDRSSLRFIDDAPRDVVRFAARVRSDVARYRPAAVVVDYLGALDGRGNTEYEKVTNATKGICSLAVELRLPLVAIHQLRRHSQDERKERRPRMTDLRGSGQIEQDATQIILGWQPFKCGETGASESDVAWQVVKSRRGQSGALATFTLSGAMSRMDLRERMERIP